MSPVIPFAVTYGPEIAAWLLRHPDELGDAFARLARPVMAAVTDPAASLDRIGPALVAVQNGQAEVIGLLHQHTTQLDGIAAAVDGVGAGVDGLGRSVGLLTSLSVVGLGVAALSQAHLAFQFAALTRRLDRLAAEVRHVRSLIQAEHQGRLDAGLTKLKNGLDVAAERPDRAAAQFTAVNTLIDSSANYARQLRTRLGGGDPAYLWLLARHLIVSALGEAAAHLRLGQTGLAVRSLGTALAPLRDHARAVFERTVAARPGAFLTPALAGHGVTLEAVAELYRQAGHAGVRDDPRRVTAADVFESLRGRLLRATDPVFFKARKARRLRAEFAEAVAAVEEVNRLRGLALAIGRYGGSGPDYLDLTDQIIRDIEARRPADGTCFAVFPNAGGPGNGSA